MFSIILSHKLLYAFSSDGFSDNIEGLSKEKTSFYVEFTSWTITIEFFYSFIEFFAEIVCSITNVVVMHN